MTHNIQSGPRDHLLLKRVLLKLVGPSLVLNKHDPGLYRGVGTQRFECHALCFSSLCTSSSQDGEATPAFSILYTRISMATSPLSPSFSPDWLSHFYDVHGCF